MMGARNKLIVGFVSLVLTFFHIMHICEAQIIYVYTSTHHQGTSERISIKRCSNLPQRVAGKVQSIDTLDNCARLYASNNCKGESIEILSNSPSHYALEDWNFNNKARSAGPCPDACHTSVTGQAPDKPFQVELFDQPKYAGYSRKINVQGCTRLPKFFSRHSGSIRTLGHCVKIFNNVECKMEKTGVDTKSIELRPGTPYNEILHKWNFRVRKAISHCAHKCHDSTSVPKPCFPQVLEF